MTNAGNEGLFQSGLNALKWNYLGGMTRTLAGLIIGTLLARILGPEPYGQIAVAMLVIGLTNLVGDFGLGTALVQRDTITDDDIRLVYTIQLVFGFILSGLVFASSGYIALAFQASDVAEVIRALAPVFILQSLGLTATSLLKRDLAFRKIQTAAITSYLVSYVIIGIPMALWGYGVWSLVVAQLSQVSLQSLLVYVFTRHSIKPIFHGSYRMFVGFGGKIVATNLANWTTSNFDDFLVGRSFGITALGLYSRAFVLTSLPMNTVVVALQGVLFPAAARAQKNPGALRQAYLGSTALIGVALIPALASMAVVPRTIIEGIYGPGWSGAIVLLTPLALAMPFNALLALSGPILWGMGRVDRELRAQTAGAIVSVITLLIAAQFSLRVLAWSVLGTYIIRWFLVGQAANKSLGVTWITVLHVLVRPASAACITAGLVFLTDIAQINAGVEPTMRLVGDGVIGVITLSSLLLLGPRLFLSDIGRSTIVRLAKGLPGPLPRFIVLRIEGVAL